MERNSVLVMGGNSGIGLGGRRLRRPRRNDRDRARALWEASLRMTRLVAPESPLV